MAIVLQATWVSKPGSEGLIRAALAELAPQSRAEAGNLAYSVFVDPEQPSVFRIFEVYADQAALDAHSASGHFQSIVIDRVIPELSERRRELFELLEV